MTGATLSGLAEVLSNLAHWSGAVAQGGKAAVSDSLDEALGFAQDLCPVLTGHLQESLTVILSADGSSGTLGTDVLYGPYVEFGTRYAGAQPFLYPAWQREVPLFKERIKRAVLL